MSGSSDTASAVGLEAIRALPSVVAAESTVLGAHATLREMHDPIAADFTLPAIEALAVIVVTAGEYVLETGRPRSGRHALLRPGVSSVTAPGREVRARWASSSATPFRSRQLHVHNSWLQHVADELGVEAPHPDYLFRDDALVAIGVGSIAAAVRRNAPRLHLDTLLLGVVGHLVLQGAEAREPRLRGLDAHSLALVIDHMRANMHEQITLDDLATLAHLSRHHFLRRFTDVMQVTPMRYLTTLRMQHAQTLLRRHDLPVASVALACGYTDASAFASAFRRATGSSPRSFRAAR